MYALDFEYDGQYLSDLGFIICDFGSSSGATTASAGSKIVFNTASKHHGKLFSLVGTKYDECIQTTFDICKNPDVFDDLKISDEEFRKIFRWLNRKEFLKFRIIDNEDLIEPRFYYASFNVSKIKIADVLYGLNLAMETDKPFAYGKERRYSWDITDPASSVMIYDYSDEIGTLYPDVKILCQESGDLTITNNFDNSLTEIKNCSAGEEITILGSSQIITSSDTGHDICNDFNYQFPKIGNSYNNRSNRITVSLACNLEVLYSPIIKDTP